MALLDDIVSVLEDASVATFGTDLFAGGFPTAAPDECLALFTYAGQAGVDTFGLAAGGGPALEQPRVQVMGRGAYFDVVMAKVQAAYAALVAVVDQDINSKHYARIEAVSTPFGLGQDAKGLQRVGANFDVTKDPE